MTLPRFYPILDAESLARRNLSPVVASEAILEGGARILQFRHKTFFSREAFAAAERIAALCREAGALYVVNDRADFAMLLGAAVHLGQDDIAPGDARRIMPERSIIGYSTHNEPQLVEADREPVDYLAFGPVFATGSKRNPDPVAGVEELRRVRALTKKPLVAIGGIARRTAESVWAAGADSVAIIGDLYPADGTKESLRSRTEEWVKLSNKQ